MISEGTIAMALRTLGVATALAAAIVAGPVVAGAAGAPAAAPAAQDVAYLQAAHQSNLLEIATGNQAQEKGRSQQVKDLGARFVTDHTRLDQSLQQTASSLGVPLAPADAARQATTQLGRVPAGQYDRVWIPLQQAAHTAAMKNGQREIANGSDATVKQDATAAAPVLEEHHVLLNQATSQLGNG
jgi:putative membrane protein